MTTPDPVINPDVEETGHCVLAAYSDAEGTFGIAVGRHASQVRTIADFYTAEETDAQPPQVPLGTGHAAALNVEQATELRDRIDAWLEAKRSRSAAGQHSSRGFHYAGEAASAAVVQQVPTAEIEELASDLTPEQDARVSALHQAAAVASRLVESAMPKPDAGTTVNFDVGPETVLTFARWVISGDVEVDQ